MADSMKKPALEFQNGMLVKVDGMRPEYMDGYALIRLTRALAAEVLELRARVAELDGTNG